MTITDPKLLSGGSFQAMAQEAKLKREPRNLAKVRRIDWS